MKSLDDVYLFFVENSDKVLVITETGVYERLVRRQLHKVSNRIMEEDPEELDAAADTIDTLMDDETSNSKLSS